MNYRVLISNKAQKDLNRLDRKYLQVVENMIAKLATDPLKGKKLSDNLKNLRSVRVGVYRIIYSMAKKELIITVVSVDHRQGVYRRLK